MLLPERGGSPNADRIASLYLVALVFVGVTAVGSALADAPPGGWI